MRWKSFIELFKRERCDISRELMVYRKRNKIKGRKISLTPDADRTPRRPMWTTPTWRIVSQTKLQWPNGFCYDKTENLANGPIIIMLWKTTPILDSKWQIWTGRRSGINTLSERWVKTSLTMAITYFEYFFHFSWEILRL